MIIPRDGRRHMPRQSRPPICVVNARWRYQMALLRAGRDLPNCEPEEVARRARALEACHVTDLIKATFALQCALDGWLLRRGLEVGDEDEVFLDASDDWTDADADELRRKAGREAKQLETLVESLMEINRVRMAEAIASSTHMTQAITTARQLAARSE